MTHLGLFNDVIIYLLFSLLIHINSTNLEIIFKKLNFTQLALILQGTFNTVNTSIKMFFFYQINHRAAVKYSL